MGFEIVVDRGGVEIHRFTVHSVTNIGRHPQNDVVLEDVSLSRFHARLVAEHGGLTLVDLGSQNGVYIEGRRVVGSMKVEPGQRIDIGRYALRCETSRNPALDESTNPEDNLPRAGALPRVEVTDPALLQRALPHVRIGRHFVFVDDAQAVMPPSGRMQRLLGYKQKKGRVVKPLADASVEIAGAKIHPAPPNISRLAGLSCDRDLYRAEQDLVRLLVAIPGGTSATIRVSLNGAPFTERVVDVPHGLGVESLAMLLPGKYEAQLMIAGEDVGEPARFTVAEYTLAPLSARLLEHRLDRASQTLSVALAVESYAVPWDRPLRAALVENGREISEIVLTMERPGRFTGKARVLGDGPFKVRCTAVDDPARVAEVALPGSRRRERQLTLAGELGKELFVSLMPEPNALPVRGLHVSQGDFVATPIVVDNVIGDRCSLRANEDVESLVVAAYDPARDGYAIFELGDLARGVSAEIDVSHPMCVAFVGCFVHGEPFEAFTSLFAAERPVHLDVPETCLPGSELAITVRTGRSHPVPMILCVRDERLTATDSPQSTLAAATKRAIESASAGLGEEFHFATLEELLPPPESVVPTMAGRLGDFVSSFSVRISENGGPAWSAVFEQPEVAIGRIPGNDVVLAKGNVSKRHTRLVLKDGKLVVVDLKSTNGTYVNGKRITSPQVLKDYDKIHVGDFLLEVEPHAPGPALATKGAAGGVFLGGDDSDDLFEESGRSAAFADEDVEAGAFDDDGDVAEEIAAGDELADEDEVSTAELRMKSLAQPRAPSGRAPATAPAEDASVRAVFPEVLFCGLVEIADGDQVRVPCGDALGAFAVEVFFVDGGDFGEARARVQIDKPVRVDLDCAPEIDPADRVQGTLRAASRGGNVRVGLSCDGRDVVLKSVDGRVIGKSDTLPSGIELVFEAGPGVWRATATDAAPGALDTMELRVGAPGVYRTVAREIVLLDKGKSLKLDGDMISMRVLPGIDAPFQMLAEATAGYDHMCCEQTAAKILSAAVMFLSADAPAMRQRAEEIILAGVARERTMHKKGRGFSMYPDESGISEHYTPKVVQYLWTLDGLADLPGMSRQLSTAVRDALAMADDVAARAGLRRIPDKVETMEDAWALAVREPRRQREALELVARTVSLDDGGARLRTPTHRVAERATLAWAAAVLFASGKTQTALRVANEVLRQLNAQGRLYSTVDSVAAIALMVQLKRTGIVGGGAEVVVNGRSLSALDASTMADQVEVIDVKEGVAVVEVTRAREERWAEARASFPLKVGFRDDAGRPAVRFRRGDKAELVVSMPKGYVEGDLVHVCLPPAMAWLEGGGRVKRFTCDFAGRSEVRVPVVVTHALTGKQHFAVAVRNMFEEERIASPGVVVIEPA